MKERYTIKDMKVTALLKDVELRVKNIFGENLNDIILYGSYARNDNTSESDIDIMILVDEEDQYLRKYEDQLTDIMVDLSLEYEVVVSLYAQAMKEYTKQVQVVPFLKNIQREGIKVF